MTRFRRRGVACDDVEEFIRRRASAIATAHAVAVESDAGGRGQLDQQHSSNARAAARMRDLQVGCLIAMKLSKSAGHHFF